MWLVLPVVALAACSSGGSDAAAPTTRRAATTTTSSTGLGEGFGPARNGRRPLAGFGEVAATITSADGTTCEVCLLAATTDAQRQRGLMEVTDPELGGYDGMLFRFPSDVDGGFWMRNTPMPLSIAYFDGDGAFVSAVDMLPCSDSASCPSYAADAPFRSALEVPAGALEDLGVGEGATIRVDAESCPLARSSG